MTKLTDAEIARNEYKTYVETAYKIPSLVADARRKKYEQRDREGREAGTITEEENDDSGNWSHDRRRKEATVHKRDPEEAEEALSDGDDCERARNEYIDRVTSMWKTCGR